MMEDIPVSEKVIESPMSICYLMDMDEFTAPTRVRAWNCFNKAGIRTVPELLGWKVDELLGIKNFGKKCLEQTVAALDKLGLALKQSG